MSGRWTPGIGDPGVLGWATVAAYFAAAAMCALAARRDAADPRASRFWAFVATTTLLLGINKQLDLQSLLTQVARDAAQRHGWYEQRRTLQAAFIFVVAGGGAVAIGVLWRSVQVLRRNIRVALAGLAFVFAYVVIRASSFHHVDIFINTSLLGVKWNWIFELSGIVVIFGAAFAAVRHRAARPRTRP